MSPAEQVDALLLLRGWLNGISLTEKQREELEHQTRMFLVHQPTENARRRSLLERLGWTPAARPRPLPVEDYNPSCGLCGRSRSYHFDLVGCPDGRGKFRP